jgi:hypothetical protein
MKGPIVSDLQVKQIFAEFKQKLSSRPIEYSLSRKETQR